MPRNLLGHNLKKRNYNQMISSLNNINKNQSEGNQSQSQRKFVKILDAKIIVDPKDINDSARKVKVTPENELKEFLGKEEKDEKVENLNDKNINFLSNERTSGNLTSEKKSDNFFNPFTQVYNIDYNPFKDSNITSTNIISSINPSLNNNNNSKNNNSLNKNNEIFNPFKNCGNSLNNNQIFNPFKNTSSNKIFNPFSNYDSIPNVHKTVNFYDTVKSTEELKKEIFSGENSVLSFNFNDNNKNNRFKEEDEEESDNGNFDPEEEVPINNDSNVEKKEIEKPIVNENKFYDNNVDSFAVYNWNDKKYVSLGKGKISIEKYYVNNKITGFLIFRIDKTMKILFQGNIIPKISNIEDSKSNKLLVYISRIYTYETGEEKKEEKKTLVNKALRIHFLNLSDLEEFCQKFQDFLNLMDSDKLKTPGKIGYGNNSHSGTYDKKITNPNLQNISDNSKSESKIKNINENDNKDNSCLYVKFFKEQ